MNYTERSYYFYETIQKLLDAASNVASKEARRDILDAIEHLHNAWDKETEKYHE